MFLLSNGTPALAKEASGPASKHDTLEKGPEVKAKAKAKAKKKGKKVGHRRLKRKRGVLPRRKKPGKPKLSPKTQKARKELLDLFKDPPK
jgi:hypothetical protein